MFPAHSASCLALSAPGAADSASQDRILPARQQDHADMAAASRGVFDGQTAQQIWALNIFALQACSMKYYKLY